MDLNANSGKINLTRTFTINVENAIVNGETIDLTDYTDQGMCYSSGKLYVPLTGKPAGKPNVSIVLVYEGVSESSGGELSKTESYRITSSKFSNLFEIESCGIHGGKLWFNTNRDNGGQADGIHYFND